LSAPHIDHVGIIVSDLEQAVAKLRLLFGENITIRELPDAGLRVAEFHAANVVIELLQYTGGSESAFARQVMGERIGLNHISARVKDVGRSVAELTAAGFTPMQGFPRRARTRRVLRARPGDRFAVRGLQTG
jgi:methylmalonyl-CoA/ethylmalonyl-CoA epimerase